MLVLKSYEDLEKLLDSLLSEDNGHDVQLEQIAYEISNPVIHFTDAGNNSCIDGKLIKILSRLQDKIYKDFGLLL